MNVNILTNIVNYIKHLIYILFTDVQKMGRICYLDHVTSQLFTVNHVTLLTNYDGADADFMSADFWCVNLSLLNHVFKI